MPFEITPEVRGGVVTLRGRVGNVKAKRAAKDVARHTVGVVRVKNRLKARPAGDLTDAEILENLREALARDPFIEGFEVTASVVDGVARLYGTVDSYFEKGRADDVASRTKGIVAVRNNISVEGGEQPLTYEPYVEEDVHPYNYPWYDYEPSPTYTRDSEIETDIEDELWWSPFVDRDQVTVSVENGVAHLTGRVDTWAERDAATRTLTRAAIRGWTTTCRSSRNRRRSATRPAPRAESPRPCPAARTDRRGTGTAEAKRLRRHSCVGVPRSHLGTKTTSSHTTTALRAMPKTGRLPQTASSGMAVLVHSPPPMNGSCSSCLEAKASAAGVS